MTRPDPEMVEIEYTTSEHKITVEMLPIGPVWEEDGACWKADLCGPGEGCEWRWHPLNQKAFSKEGPQGQMTASALGAALTHVENEGGDYCGIVVVPDDS